MTELEATKNMLNRINQKCRILDLYAKGSTDDDLPTAYRLVIVLDHQHDYIMDFDAKTGELLSIG